MNPIPLILAALVLCGCEFKARVAVQSRTNGFPSVTNTILAPTNDRIQTAAGPDLVFTNEPTPELPPHTNPPPTYRIVCDSRGFFAPYSLNRQSVFGGLNHTNKQSAIEHAWTVYALETNHVLPRTQPDSDWRFCE